MQSESRTFNAEKPPKKAVFQRKVVGVQGLEPWASCSQSRRATNCATPRYEVRRSGWAYSPKCRALPVEPHPDIQFLPLYHGGGENQSFFCLWSFLWSKPFLCRFRQSGKIQQTQVSQGFAAFRLVLSRIPPRHSQTTHFLFFVHTAQEPTANFCRIDGPNCIARATIRC